MSEETKAEIPSFSRSGQRSVVAVAAYRAGENLYDEQAGKTFDYTHKHHAAVSAILTPEHTKDWAKNRQQFWNKVANHEKEKGTSFIKETVLMLPRNLDQDQRKQLVEDWANDNLVRKKCLIVDYTIHEPNASHEKYHTHLLYYTQPIAENGEFVVDDYNFEK